MVRSLVCLLIEFISNLLLWSLLFLSVCLFVCLFVCSLRVPPHAIAFWEKLNTIPLFGIKHMTITLVMLEPHQPFGLFWLNEFLAVLEVRYSRSLHLNLARYSYVCVSLCLQVCNLGKISVLPLRVVAPRPCSETELIEDFGRECDRLGIVTCCSSCILSLCVVCVLFLKHVSVCVFVCLCVCS